MYAKEKKRQNENPTWSRPAMDPPPGIPSQPPSDDSAATIEALIEIDKDKNECFVDTFLNDNEDRYPDSLPEMNEILKNIFIF